MNPTERKRILEMLASGKITAAEADDLLESLSNAGASQSATSEAPRANTASSSTSTPKYLRVVVEGQEEGEEQKVNIRVPMQLIRAGMRMSALMPSGVQDKVDEALAAKGIPTRLKDMKPENMEELIAMLSEFSVDVDQKNQKVRIFCE